ncbi:hypothetical protein D3C73_888520 [compost metagenome]
MLEHQPNFDWGFEENHNMSLPALQAVDIDKINDYFPVELHYSSTRMMNVHTEAVEP